MHHELMLMNQQPGPAELLELLPFSVNAEIGYLGDDTFNEVTLDLRV